VYLNISFIHGGNGFQINRLTDGALNGPGPIFLVDLEL